MTSKEAGADEELVFWAEEKTAVPSRNKRTRLESNKNLIIL